MAVTANLGIGANGSTFVVYNTNTYCEHQGCDAMSSDKWKILFIYTADCMFLFWYRSTKRHGAITQMRKIRNFTAGKS
jgi:hypothetical protein